MEEKVTMMLKPLQNCEETTVFVKKKVYNLTYKQGLLFEKSKQPNRFTASKTCKSVRKVSKTRSGNKF